MILHNYGVNFCAHIQKNEKQQIFLKKGVTKCHFLDFIGVSYILNSPRLYTILKRRSGTPIFRQKKGRFKMKKFISVLLAAAMMISASAVGVYAEGNEPNGEIMPLYDCNSKATSAASVNGNSVRCVSNIVVIGSETWSSITQTIEKQNSLGKWYSTSYTWTKNADNPSLNYIYSNTTTISNSGTYRLRSDLVVKASNGFTETITSHSGTFII